MSRRARLLVIAGAVLAALLLGVGLWLYTPDGDRRALEARYAAAPSQFVEVLGLRLHVRDTGPRGAPAVLMLHGFASSLQTWDAWAAALEDRYRVIRLDLPGFGLTGPDPTDDYSDARAVAVVAGLLDRLGVGRASLVGNSMGGHLAWLFAAGHPERTERVVLVSPAGFRPPGPDGAKPASLPWAIRMMRYVLPKFVLRMNLAPSYADPARLTPAVVQRYLDMLLVPGVRGAILSRMLQTEWPDPVPVLRTVRAPVLLVWGEADRLVPFSNAADYLAVLPDVRLAALPGEGHVPQEEVPGVALMPVERFLGE